MTPSTSTLACFLKYQSHSLTWLTFFFAAIFSHICFWQVNADIPAIEKAIQASGSKVSSFVFVFFSTGPPQSSFVFFLFQLGLYKVPLCLSFFDWVSTKFFCVCLFSTGSLQSSWCSGEDVRGGPEGVRAGDSGSLGQLNHLNWALGAWCSSAERVLHLLVEHLVHLVHLGAFCAPWNTLCVPLRSTLSERWSTLYLLKPCPAVTTFCNRYSVIIYSKANIQTLKVIQQ